MIDYRSIDHQMKETGYVMEHLLGDGDLPESLARLAIDVARGKYKEVKIVPSDIAMKGEDWVPCDPCHIVYVKRSDAYQTEMDRKHSFTLIAPICRHVETGEISPVKISS